MRTLAEIERRLSALTVAPAGAADAGELLGLAEEVLEAWVRGRGEEPTLDRQEGFRLLGLHRQGARRLPSFNACRETCREIAYHFNLLISYPEHVQTRARAQMLALLVNHLCLFVTAKCQAEGIGEFCCASRPLRLEAV